MSKGEWYVTAWAHNGHPYLPFLEVEREEEGQTKKNRAKAWYEVKPNGHICLCISTEKEIPPDQRFRLEEPIELAVDCEIIPVIYGRGLVRLPKEAVLELL